MALYPRCECEAHSGCKISMLLNSNTIGSCFLSSDWKIATNSMFAGTCVGVFALALFLEFLRCAGKEWDRYIARRHAAAYRNQHNQQNQQQNQEHELETLVEGRPGGGDQNEIEAGRKNRTTSSVAPDTSVSVPLFRPNVWEQGARSLLHTAQFTVAYFVMLLAMYFNVYILVSIFLGVLVGNAIFVSEFMTESASAKADASGPTVCCG
ncbi:hypothetical protein N3K66_005540 [Trichothecium roseum]|uniref:Uncharacterized protein n=1 Tax=Trichothecium roseum TaxID=47278 RepID=A0ACC0UY53_9HYPO|nr:hypothetical protein N3K66_005540 [Trichothecium roseum]